MANTNETVRTVWKMLCKLRAKGMDTNEYKNYVLPFMFYSYASFRVTDYMKKVLENEEEAITYAQAWNKVDEKGNYIYRDALSDEQIENFGFVIEPQYIANTIVMRTFTENSTEYFGDVFDEAITAFEKTCSDKFKGTLSFIDLYNEALGDNQYDQDEILKALFQYSYQVAYESYTNKGGDVLGANYEALMSLFAASAGKKGGEFYTPAEVSKLVAKLATLGVINAKTISDPTCGSGSLLLKAYEEIKSKGGIVGTIHGQELNNLTSKLARMNMCMHEVNTDDFDITCCDTLSYTDNSAGKFFDVTVANPPYAVPWDNSVVRESDNRFMGYGALAPKSNADLAFLQHIVYHMSDNGRAAVLLPLGVLFRGNAEQTIRQALIETYNVIDGIVMLPSNCFFGASIPVCCIVLRKDRGNQNNVVFIDASNEFIKVGNKNELTEEGINKIVEAYTNRQDIEHFCSIVDREVIAQNDYNLNIPLYVEAEKVVVEHDIDQLFNEFKNLEAQAEQLKATIDTQLGDFGVTARFGAPASDNNNSGLSFRGQTVDTSDGMTGKDLIK